MADQPTDEDFVAELDAAVDEPSEDGFLVELGRAVRAERVRHGWTQGELAERAGVSKAAISHLEVARRRPTKGLLKALAAALGTSVPELLAQVRQHAPSMASVRAGGATLMAGAAYAASGPGAFVRTAHRRLQDVLGRDEPEDDRSGQLPAWVRDQPVGLKLEQAEGILHSPDAVTALVENVDGKLDRLRDELGDEVVTVARLMASLVTFYARGEYRACRQEVASVLVGALSYLQEDDDALPGVLTDKGIFDDIGVVVFAADWAADDLDVFERWLTAVQAPESA